MGFSELRKKAKIIVKYRSLKPDFIYILYALVLSITIVGLPVAYGIVKDYYSYLTSCVNKYYADPDAYKSNKRKVIEYKNPLNTMFEYNFKSAVNVLKTAICLILPIAACFDVSNLNEDQNLDAKIRLIQLKSYFIYIFIEAIVILFLIGVAVFADSVEIAFISIGIAVILMLVMFKPFVLYCQTFAMFRKECSEWAEENEYDEYNEYEDLDE